MAPSIQLDRREDRVEDTTLLASKHFRPVVHERLDLIARDHHWRDLDVRKFSEPANGQTIDPGSTGLRRDDYRAPCTSWSRSGTRRPPARLRADCPM